MNNSLFTIGKLSKNSGVKVTTIRFYEKEGMISEFTRNEGNQRLYSMKELERIKFIKHARDLGFSMQDIKELISLQGSSQSDCSNAHQIIETQLLAIQEKISKLNKLEIELKRISLLKDNGVKDSCKVIETLADHSYCLSDH